MGRENAIGALLIHNDTFLREHNNTEHHRRRDYLHEPGLTKRAEVRKLSSG